MDKYIIYSGGGKGYGLYASSPDFPDAYRNSVSDLYENQRIVASSAAQGNHYCCRFAPLKDAYLLSVIYRDCTCAEENRSFFATVNWLFTAEEADELLGGDMRKPVLEYVLRSDLILEEAGYIFKMRESPMLCREASWSENEEKAYASAVYFATKAVCEDNGQLSAQVFVGCENERALFDNVFWALFDCPRRFRKFVSFYIGATAVSETFGVSLVVMHEAILDTIVAAGDYSGSMAVRKMTLLRDKFTSLFVPPATAEAYARLTNEQKQRAGVLFAAADQIEGYWQYVLAVSEQGEGAVQGAALVMLMGERAFLDALVADVFAEQEIETMCAEREKLKALPLAMAALNEHATIAEEKQKAFRLSNAMVNDFSSRLSDGEQEDDHAEDDEKKDKKKGKKKGKKDKKKGKAKDETKDEPAREGEDDHQDDHEKEDHAQEKKEGDKCHHARPCLAVRIWKSRGALWSLLWPLFLAVACLLVMAVFGYGVYYFGIAHIAFLPIYWARILFAAQIVGCLLVGMLLGQLMLMSLKRLFSPAKRKKEEE